MQVLNVHVAVAKCAWSSTACAEMCMEQCVLKCAWSSCLCMSSECESDGEHTSSIVPSPTPSFSSLLSTVKRGGPGTFPHVSDVKGRKG